MRSALRHARPIVGAVLFDLFGTVVPGFSRSRHEVLTRTVAGMLGVHATAFQRLWLQLLCQRARGAWGAVEDTLEYVCTTLNVRPGPAAIADARAAFDSFILDQLSCDDATLAYIDELRAKGALVGLVSNCTPPLPAIWPRTALASRFHAVGFSCVVGAMKPDAAIYLSVCGELGVHPRECAYVGDGSNEELTGAAALRMRSVLLKAPCEDTYDPVRTDVLSWAGPCITSIDALKSIVRVGAGRGVSRRSRTLTPVSGAIAMSTTLDAATAADRRGRSSAPETVVVVGGEPPPTRW